MKDFPIVITFPLSFHALYDYFVNIYLQVPSLFTNDLSSKFALCITIVLLHLANQFKHSVPTFWITVIFISLSKFITEIDMDYSTAITLGFTCWTRSLSESKKCFSPFCICPISVIIMSYWFCWYIRWPFIRRIQGSSY